MKSVVVVNYGVGNLKSVQRGLEVVGAKVELTTKADAVAQADRLVLPGVGAFKDGMAGLRAGGFIDAIREVVAKGNPVMGICLGMQMLMDWSDEFGRHEGLGVIPGSVTPIPDRKADGVARKIPHIGWNNLNVLEGGRAWSETLLRKTDSRECFYFVHSFMAETENPAHKLADCEYEGQSITAAVSREQVIGLQFHPEKSGESGLRLLREFVDG